MEFNLCLFKKQLERTSKIATAHDVLISLYVPPDIQMSEVMEYLQGKLTALHEEESDQISRSVRLTISSLLDHLATSDIVAKGNGIVLLFGELNGKIHRQAIDPPHPVQSLIYRCEREFYLDPLFQMIEYEETYGILVMDLAEATIGYLIGSNIQVHKKVESRVPNNHHHGGMSSLRFERTRDDAINDYFKKISERCTEAFMGHVIKGIIIGGPGMTKNDFIAGEYLHHELRKMIIGVVDVNENGKQGLRGAVDAAEGYLSTCQYVKEKRTMDHFWGEKGSGGLVVSGLEETLQELNIGKIQTLIMSYTLDLETIATMKRTADRFNTDVMIISEEEEFGKSFLENIKVGGILRYK